MTHLHSNLSGNKLTGSIPKALKAKMDNKTLQLMLAFLPYQTLYYNLSVTVILLTPLQPSVHLPAVSYLFAFDIDFNFQAFL